MTVATRQWCQWKNMFIPKVLVHIACQVICCYIVVDLAFAAGITFSIVPHYSWIIVMNSCVTPVIRIAICETFIIDFRGDWILFPTRKWPFCKLYLGKFQTIFTKLLLVWLFSCIHIYLGCKQIGLTLSEQSGNNAGKLHGAPIFGPSTALQGNLYVSSTVLWDTFRNSSSRDQVCSRNCILFESSVPLFRSVYMYNLQNVIEGNKTWSSSWKPL